MLIDEAGFVPGVDLLFGSDGMPHGPEYALRWSLFPDYEEQRLSIKEFEAGYGPALGIEGEGSAFAIDDQARTINRNRQESGLKNTDSSSGKAIFLRAMFCGNVK